NRADCRASTVFPISLRRGIMRAHLGEHTMSKAKKPPLVKLSEMTPGQQAAWCAWPGEKPRKTPQTGKPFYPCRFRDPRRTATVMVWADSGFFEDCQTQGQVGRAFKSRGTCPRTQEHGH